VGERERERESKGEGGVERRKNRDHEKERERKIARMYVARIGNAETESFSCCTEHALTYCKSPLRLIRKTYTAGDNNQQHTCLCAAHQKNLHNWR
jgi:hypothetical protein